MIFQLSDCLHLDISENQKDKIITEKKSIYFIILLFLFLQVTKKLDGVYWGRYFEEKEPGVFDIERLAHQLYPQEVQRHLDPPDVTETQIGRRHIIKYKFKQNF